MSRLRARWATGPDDKPGPGEAVGRLRRTDGDKEVYPAAGRIAPRLTVDPETGETTATTAAPTDLVVNRSRTTLTITAADGRTLVARFDPAADAPQLDADAPADLRDAVLQLWRATGARGRPSKHDERLAEIVAAAADMGDGATRLRVAQRLGRVTQWGEERGDYLSDIRKAGGWGEIRRRASL